MKMKSSDTKKIAIYEFINAIFHKIALKNMYMYNAQLVSFSIGMLLACFDDYYTIRKQYIDLPKDRNNCKCCLIKDGGD